MTKRYGILIAGLAVLVALSSGSPAMAGKGRLRDRAAANRAQYSSWHGDNYDPAWGTPVALVVPARAKAQTDYGVGVSGSRQTRLVHQFGPGEPVSGNGFAPAPAWPASTSQSGVYYVRGPRP